MNTNMKICDPNTESGENKSWTVLCRITQQNN